MSVLSGAEFAHYLVGACQRTFNPRSANWPIVAIMNIQNTTEDVPRRSLTAVGLATGVVTVDQASKSIAGTLGCGPAICSATNDQLMLGFGGDSTPNVVLVGVVGLAIFGAWSCLLHRRRVAVSPVGVGLVVGGAFGNLIDRIAFSSVRDFLVAPLGTLLNVADLAIVLGLAVCLITARPALFQRMRGGEST